jgi:hypothetical protein
MNVFKTFFLIFVLLLLCISCGGGGTSSTSFEVSRSFAMTNPSFGGGLIITGKHLEKGITFTSALDTSTEVNMQLAKGTWRFSAVAWDGGASPEVKFSGVTYCGKIDKSLTNDSETIDLNLTSANCGDPYFTAGHVDTSTTPYKFKTLEVIGTCNTFFPSQPLPGSNINTSLANSTTSGDFCALAGVPKDLKTEVKGMKIYTQNKSVTQRAPTLGFSSNCLSESSDSVINPTFAPNPYSGRSLRLPYGSIPFTVVTYEDSDCTKVLTSYNFSNGIASAYPSFDHLLVNNNISATQMKLFLPGNKIRRAKSPFLAIMPSIRCNGNVACPTTPGTLNEAFHGFTGSPNKVILPQEDTCGVLTYTLPVDSLPTCNDLGDEVEVTFTGSAAGSGSFTMNGITYNVYLAAASLEHQRYQTQRSLIDLIGPSNEAISDTFFYPHDKGDMEDRAYGVLSEVREMFSPDGPGGVIGISGIPPTFTDACLQISGTKEITLYDNEKMINETFKITVHNSPIAAPNGLFCNIDNSDETNCALNGSGFDKRMTIHAYAFSTFVPVLAMEFNCTNFLGRLESRRNDFDSSERKYDQEIINWNTDADFNYNYQRFEKLSINNEYIYNPGTLSWDLRRTNREMLRFQKRGPDEHESWLYDFDSHWNGSGFEQHLGWQQLLSKPSATANICMLHNHQTVNHVSDANYLLEDPTYSIYQTQPADTSTPTEYFLLNATWPAVVNTTGCGANFTALTGAPSKFDGDLDFQLGSMQNATFLGKFGTTFLTDP